MNEKDQKSLTIGDILDQLIKPSVLQGPEVLSQKPAVQVLPTPQHIQSADISISSPSAPQKPTTFPSGGYASGINLPRLGGGPEKTEISGSQLGTVQPPGLKLYIRTMAADLERLKKGQQPSGLEIKSTMATPPPKTIPLPEVSSPPPKPVQPRPVLPRPVAPPLPTRPLQPPPLPVIPSAPPIQPASPGKEQEHRHIERIISEKDLLPPFLGAPIPKRVIKSKEERVEYRLIAKIIGSGMAVGITSTIVMAVVAYFLLSFFVFNREEATTPTPTPSSTGIIPAPVNELETIFKDISTVSFKVTENEAVAVSGLKAFIDIQVMTKKEFKRINFINSTDNALINRNFTGLLDIFSIRYPSELKKVIDEKYIALLYGQEELFGESGQSVPRKLVFVVEVKDIVKTTEIMTGWEPTMANDLRELFNIDPTKEASRTFLNNEHRGVKIRYKNFPLPDKSLDYAVLSSLTGKHYLILTNSRESMYSPTDKLQGL